MLFDFHKKNILRKMLKKIVFPFKTDFSWYMRSYCPIGFMVLMAITPIKLEGQLASPVIDPTNNIVGAIAKAVAKASRVVRETILPFKESISKVQKFFKEASEKVNVVIKNLQMTKELIEMENKISDLFLHSLNQIEAADNLPYKWKHRWRLARLWYESRELLQVFDVAYVQEKGIMDDQQRITLIKETLARLRKVYTAMKLSIRRSFKLEHAIRKKQREIEFFEEFFQFN